MPADLLGDRLLVKADDPRNHTNQHEHEFVRGIFWIVLVFFEGLASKRLNALAPRAKRIDAGLKLEYLFAALLDSIGWSSEPETSHSVAQGKISDPRELNEMISTTFPS